MIPNDMLVYLAVLLLFKHMIADFFYQPAWMLNRKGQLFKGGLEAHALLHGVLSVVCFELVGETRTEVLATLFVIEYAVHYCTDFIKARFNMAFELKPHEPEFWMLLGADQFIHGVTMVAMVYYATVVA